MENMGLTTKRIESLTDGIFAIAMTILVLNLHLPDGGASSTNSMLQHQLLGQANKIFNYFLSFVLLAVFWMVHHQQFHVIKRTDRTHLWINVLLLMFVALVPFSTSLVGDFSSAWIDELCFSANLFIIGLLFYWNWSYATQQHRLVDETLEEKRIQLGKRRSLVLPVVSVLAMLTSYIFTPLATLVFILIPILLALPGLKN